MYNTNCSLKVTFYLVNAHQLVVGLELSAGKCFH